MTESDQLNSRRVLCVSPRYAPSFGTFEYAYELMKDVRAFMPPQGLLVIAAALPANWDVRFIDENMTPATAADFAWAEVVFVSGMHVQQPRMHDICARAHKAGRVAVLGGPSVSACPDYYPDFDYLHIGELGDATEALFARLSADCSRPPSQVVLTTKEKRPLTECPPPAYELAEIERYFLGSVQFSSGCPYQCEFCDIPGLYGRVPRLKSPEQILRELDKLLEQGVNNAVYFVDDNFIANRRAVKELLPHLIDWQRRNGYALSFACEATLNIARAPELLAMMREAGFETVFCGIETPDPEALKAMSKSHNMMVPILEGVRTLNSYGMEVVSVIILGLDTDTLESGRGILDFIKISRIPMLTINLLQALPQTPLWDRLKRSGRLIHDDERESNVDFLLPYDAVVEMWRETMAEAYDPAALFERYEHQVVTTYANRFPRPASKQRTSWRNIRLGMGLLAKILWKVGVRSDYRHAFWAFAWPKLKRGQIEPVIQAGLVSRHLIRFARQASSGAMNASYYSAKQRDPIRIAAE
ncbi:MAG TPA: B12-binding domain-containing radical SAM protein [Caulobacteraceae bacterium]|nr:B12-binding domain-containing radical SAM protein [Caulobacteraceae bacterium]